MDNVLVDFQSGIKQLDRWTRIKYAGRLDEVPGIFSKMKPMDGAIEAVKKLSRHYDLYILSTAPWNNPSAWTDKLNWIKKYLPLIGLKRLILTHNKHLNKGDFLVDDRIKNGADRFEGELIQFGSEKFPDWRTVSAYLLGKAKD
ncbi:MAG TPA: hypothetical protein ENN61_05400 [Bacteroidaceae bacterium]|nr:hypothetical protein [Bacteroidaceae bacterium]